MKDVKRTHTHTHEHAKRQPQRGVHRNAHTHVHTHIHTSLINKTLHRLQLYKRERGKGRDSKLLAWLSMATVF